MFSSETISTEMSTTGSFLHPNPSNEGQLMKSRDSMGSDLFLNQSQIEQSNQQHGCGLARYRSAPSSLLASLLDSTTDNSSSGDESEAMFSALLNGPPTPRDLNQKAGAAMHYQLKQEIGAESEARPGSMMGYESDVSGVGGAVVGSYSVGMENQVDLRMNSGNNLLRQSSSPAGFFNGSYGIIGELESYRVHNHSKATSSSVRNHNISFSSTPPSSSRFLPSIPESENSNDAINGARSHETGRFFPQDSWNDASFNTLKRNRDGVFSNFNGLEDQSGETRRSPHGLVHHLSLPKTASEMAEVEKFLQLQSDSVPCQIRAKRGCATHPRSIAERIRRTRISEKMKKLQDLFPNMDKQTSTADMLDLAVQFIKDLQEQVETLAETKANCLCSRIPQ